MPPDIAPLDIAAFVWFAGSWLCFTVIQDHLMSSGNAVNQHLKIVRRHWMERMLERDNRIMDSQLFGHTMQSCTFFASTNMLILAALVGSFGAIEHAQEVISNLSFTVKTSRHLFEVKMLLLLGIFTFGFFKFTWALRQFNYCCALIGSAPLPPFTPEDKRIVAHDIAEALTLAIRALNGGMRAYYFALAGLAWMIGPIPFMIATSGVIVVLTQRQAFSPTEKVIRKQTAWLESRKSQEIDNNR